MAINTLTDSAIKAVKVSDKPVKLLGGAGLFVLVKPTGAKYWRLKYRHGGLEKTLALGVYPEVSLKRAREKRDEARQLLDRQIDPSSLRKAHKQANQVAKEIGLTRKQLGVTPHSLRHGYANREYERVTNRLSPVQGGTLAKDDPAADRAVRELVADELGHSRPSIAAAYIVGTRVHRDGEAEQRGAV